MEQPPPHSPVLLPTLATLACRATLHPCPAQPAPTQLGLVLLVVEERERLSNVSLVTLESCVLLARLLQQDPMYIPIRLVLQVLSLRIYAPMDSSATSKTNMLPDYRPNLVQWASTRSQRRLPAPARLLNAPFVQRPIIAEHVQSTKTVAARMAYLSISRSWHAQRAIIAQRE